MSSDFFISYVHSYCLFFISLAIDELHAKSSHGILDLIGDSTDMMRNQKRTEKKWDPAKKKYVANNNKEKMIRSESGQWIPASMKSGRYEKWQERTKARQTEESDDDDESNKPAPSMFKLLFFSSLRRVS